MPIGSKLQLGKNSLCLQWYFCEWCPYRVFKADDILKTFSYIFGENDITPNFWLGLSRFATTFEKDQNILMEERKSLNTTRATKSDMRILI